MGKGNTKSKSGAKNKNGKNKPAKKTSAAAEALRNMNNPNPTPSQNQKKKTTAETPSDNSTAFPITKLLFTLTSDEARKESIKLGLIEEGSKSKKDVCLILISEYLGKHGLSSSSFKFAPDGKTDFPAVLLPTETDDEDNESDDFGDSSDSSEDEDEVPIVVNSKTKRSSKKHSRRVFGGGQVPSGWYVMPHPRTGEPVGMLRDSDGKYLELRDPTTATHTSLPRNETTNETTSRQISEAASMLGGSQRIFTPASDNVPSHSRSVHFADHVKSVENLEFCNGTIPSFVYNQEKEINGSRKLVSGMFTIGKKEVLQKEIYPHHLVDSYINPKGVEYSDMNIQELNNGFTAMILAKCDKNTDPVIVNMLKHLNRLNAYLMFAPVPDVLEFNGGFMLGLENRTQSWSNGTKMQEYHDRHNHSLKLGSIRGDHVKNDTRKNRNDKDVAEEQKPNDKKPRCTKEWTLKKGICFNFQSDQCDQAN